MARPDRLGGAHAAVLAAPNVCMVFSHRPRPEENATRPCGEKVTVGRGARNHGRGGRP